jgi:ribosomal protein L37AE/L43A
MDFFRRFMAGRYGPDSLNRALSALALLDLLVALLTGKPLLLLLGLALWGIVYFRMFSRNISKRYEENQRWLQFYGKVRDRFRRLIARLRDREHRYFKCPDCGTMLRVPRGRGKIQVTCPHCSRQIIKKS